MQLEVSRSFLAECLRLKAAGACTKRDRTCRREVRRELEKKQL